MADNIFRTTRRDAAAPGGQQFDDPLAELARLIGRSPPASGAPDQTQPYDAPVDAPQTDPQWAADRRDTEQYYDERQRQYDDRQPQSGDEQYSEGQYAEGRYSDRQYSEGQYGEGQYNDQQHSEGQHGEGQYSENQYGDRQYADRQYADRYDTPRFTDPSPPYRAAPPSYNADYEQPDQYAAQRQYDARGYADQQHYDDAHDPIQDVPAFLPRARQDRYGHAQQRAQDRGFDRQHDQAYAQGDDQNYGQDPDDYRRGYAQEHAQTYEQGYAQAQEGDPDQSYALEDYDDEHEEPAPKRRGFAVAAALLGLIVLGTAGAFGYRAMFGGSMMPGLPPIIKADSTPNKIIPAGSSASASAQTGGNGASPDKLVSREERPVDVPAPPGTPRVVSTVPVFPDPNSGLQSSVIPGSQTTPDQSMAGAVASGAPMSLGPTAASAYGSPGAAAVPMPGPSAVSQSPPLQSPPVAGAGSAKRIHTVAIHTGPPDNSDAAASAPRAQAGRPAPSRSVAAPQGQSGNTPMSIVPSQSEADASRTHTALAHPAAEPAPATAPSGGGYMVQVSSQRSESDAQSAYRGLQAKFPSQLGGHEATIRQVDLGEKGTFFRTLVGPYATMEQAAQMCSSLKAAGGSCLVQRN